MQDFLLRLFKPQAPAVCSTFANAADQEVKDEANPKERGWFTNLLTGPSSSLALAFLCNKALMPLRAPLTLGLTPMVARSAMYD